MLGQIIMYCVFIVIFCLCCTLIPFMVKLGLYLADKYILLYRIKRMQKVLDKKLKKSDELIKKYAQHDADIIMDTYLANKEHFKEEKNETQSND